MKSMRERSGSGVSHTSSNGEVLMTILYVIVGALTILSIGLYALLYVLKSKKQSQAKQVQKREAMQAVAKAQSE